MLPRPARGSIRHKKTQPCRSPELPSFTTSYNTTNHNLNILDMHPPVMPFLLVLAALVTLGAAMSNPGTYSHSWTWPKYTGRPAATGTPNHHWPSQSGPWNGQDWPCPSEVASQWVKTTSTPTVSLASGAVVGTTTSVPSATVSVNQVCFHLATLRRRQERQ